MEAGSPLLAGMLITIIFWSLSRALHA